MNENNVKHIEILAVTVSGYSSIFSGMRWLIKRQARSSSLICTSLKMDKYPKSSAAFKKSITLNDSLLHVPRDAYLEGRNGFQTYAHLQPYAMTDDARS
ncbi:hypothetical protein O3M35_004024 [Rhynocoris fuscipes]|uniref:Uncharacterized protein n=1 Tax=Rhynocoris fuscipes TaxID=488301 RepID=A0AAW1CI33_9HEMI